MNSVSQFVHWCHLTYLISCSCSAPRSLPGLEEPQVQIKTDENVHNIIVIMLRSGKPNLEGEVGFIRNGIREAGDFWDYAYRNRSIRSLLMSHPCSHLKAVFVLSILCSDKIQLYCCTLSHSPIPRKQEQQTKWSLNVFLLELSIQPDKDKALSNPLPSPVNLCPSAQNENLRIRSTLNLPPWTTH